MEGLLQDCDTLAAEEQQPLTASDGCLLSPVLPTQPFLRELCSPCKHFPLTCVGELDTVTFRNCEMEGNGFAGQLGSCQMPKADLWKQRTSAEAEKEWKRAGFHLCGRHRAWQVLCVSPQHPGQFFLAAAPSG